MRRARRLFATAVTVLVLCMTLPPASFGDSTTVRLSVDASESFGNPLSYRWRATDGHIVDRTGFTTDWILPNGPGIHFAYVLLSNGRGGVTEDRIAVNTDNNPTTTVVPVIPILSSRSSTRLRVPTPVTLKSREPLNWRTISLRDEESVLRRLRHC